jgi:hypothetical protein
MLSNRNIITAAVACLLPLSASQAAGTGTRDLLRLSDPALQNGEWHVAMHVQNSQTLAGLDIPLQFAQSGQPIELVRVEFTDRVADWDFKYAQIDNQAKTVIIGLISELVNTRPAADLKVAATGDTRVADLVFKADEGVQPDFAVFTTANPGHDLTFLYNEAVEGKPVVRELKPAFESYVNFKEALLPKEFALSQNFPNPFNPTTSFALSLPEASDYSVRIFNVAGQMVKSMAGHLEAGEHKLIWDGTTDSGLKVASGTYFMKAEAGSFVQTRKLTLLK